MASVPIVSELDTSYETKEALWQKNGQKESYLLSKTTFGSDSTVLQVSGKLHDPPGPDLSFQNQLPIAVGRNLYKAVVVAVEGRFAAVG